MTGRAAPGFHSRLLRGASDNTLHWVIGDVVPPDLLLALASDDESLARERERLWYVACTRARELLVVPELPQAEQRSWARIVDLAHHDLPLLDLSRFAPVARPVVADPPNGQTLAIFKAERAAIAAASVPLRWLQPSNQDPDRAPMAEAIAIGSGEAPETELPIGAGRVRGLVLHQVMEEVLTGELGEDLLAFADRPGAYRRAGGRSRRRGRSSRSRRNRLDRLANPASPGDRRPATGSFRNGRSMPCSPMRASPQRLPARIDDVALDNGRAAVVLDWKSDIAPTEEDMRVHTGQLEDYLRTTGARRGALVYMTLGTVPWVEPGVRTERNA